MIKDFLIVHKSVIPENIALVIETRKLIEDKKLSISDACIEKGISRGTYYKYKDYVFLPSQEFGKKAIFSFLLDNKKGILSNLLNYIASKNGNILSINQEMPIHGTAYVTITIDVIEMLNGLEDFIEEVKTLNGVKNAKLIAIE